MSADRPESYGPPMFDLTKRPDAHTYHGTARVMVDPATIEDRNVLPAAYAPAGLPTSASLPVRDPFEGARGKQRRTGEPILYIAAEQLYETGLSRECRIRIDLNVFLSSKDRARILESEAFNALASIGVKL